jgi:hypothetical protein
VQGPPSAEGSVEIFCSYSHKDEPLRQRFDDHVASLRNEGLVQVWTDRLIPPGEQWAESIDRRLNSADIITLFVSADFLASAYCWQKEFKRALERAEAGEVFLVPILVRACDWEEGPLGRFQAVPEEKKPVTSWSNRDEAWRNVAKSLRGLVRTVLNRKLQALSSQIARGAKTQSEVEQAARAVDSQIARGAKTQSEVEQAARAVDSQITRGAKTQPEDEQAARAVDSQIARGAKTQPEDEQAARAVDSQTARGAKTQSDDEQARFIYSQIVRAAKMQPEDEQATRALHSQTARGAKTVSDDQEAARALYAEIFRDAKAQAEERQRLMADMQTKIFALNEELGPSLPRPKKRAIDWEKQIQDYMKD